MFKLTLDYPADKLEILVASDGSDLLSFFHRVTCLVPGIGAADDRVGVGDAFLIDLEGECHAGRLGRT